MNPLYVWTALALSRGAILVNQRQLFDGDVKCTQTITIPEIEPNRVAQVSANSKGSRVGVVAYTKAGDAIIWVVNTGSDSQKMSRWKLKGGTKHLLWVDDDHLQFSRIENHVVYDVTVAFSGDLMRESAKSATPVVPPSQFLRDVPSVLASFKLSWPRVLHGPSAFTYREFESRDGQALAVQGKWIVVNAVQNLSSQAYGWVFEKVGDKWQPTRLFQLEPGAEFCLVEPILCILNQNALRHECIVWGLKKKRALARFDADAADVQIVQSAN